MKENTLLKIALISGIVGLVALYLISTKIELKDYKPNKLSQNVGDDVKFIGVIERISGKGDVAIIRVKQETSVDVVAFNAGNEMALKNGDSVEVLGKVQEYKGKNEIVAQKISVVK